MTHAARTVHKIVWFASGLRQSGGGERLLMEGVEYLSARGLDVTVVTFKFDQQALFDGRYKPPQLVELLGGAERFGVRSGFAAVRYAVRGVRLLRSRLTELDPDVVIVQSEDNAVLAWLAMLGRRRRYVTLLFGQMFQFPSDLTKYARVFRKHLQVIQASTRGYQLTIPLAAPPMSPIRRIAVELTALARYIAVRRSAVLFVLSRQVQWEIGKLYGRDSIISKGAFPSAIFDHQPPAHVRQQLALPAGRLLLTVSRLEPKKNVDLCLRAFRQICDRHPDVTLVIGGRGPEEARLKALAVELGVASRAMFVGYIPERTLWDYYASCDVFVMLDTADFDIVLYEALALGRKAVVSTDQDLDDELQNSRFIFSAEPEVDAVAAAMTRALSSEPGAMAAAERAQLASYSWNDYFQRLLATMSAL